AQAQVPPRGQTYPDAQTRHTAKPGSGHLHLNPPIARPNRLAEHATPATAPTKRHLLAIDPALFFTSVNSTMALPSAITARNDIYLMRTICIKIYAERSNSYARRF